MAAGENLELACLQLEDYRACHAWFFSRSRPKLFCKAPDHWLSFCQQHVVLKSILDGYRLRRPVRDNWVIVDTAGKFVQALTIAAEVLFEYSASREFRRSLTVCAPSFASFSPVTLPTPGKRPTGNGSRNASMSSGWMTKSPSGLRQSEASFAKNLLGATPAEAVRFNSSRICCRIVRATRVAVAKPVLFSVTSR